MHQVESVYNSKLISKSRSFFFSLFLLHAYFNIVLTALITKTCHFRSQIRHHLVGPAHILKSENLYERFLSSLWKGLLKILRESDEKNQTNVVLLFFILISMIVKMVDGP